MENQRPTLPPVWSGFLVGVTGGVLCYLLFYFTEEYVDPGHVIGTAVGTALATSLHLNGLLRRAEKKSDE